MPVIERRGYCGCVIQPRSRPCSSCLNCPEHCVCEVCASCSAPHIPDDNCPSCAYCYDCCRCVVCGGCSQRFRRDTTRNWCSRCVQCPECCKCYTCTVCSVRLTGTRQREWHEACGNCAEHCRCVKCNSCHTAISYFHRCRRCGNSVLDGHCLCAECPLCLSRVDPADMHSAGNIADFDNEPACNACAGCCRCRARGVDLRGGRFQFWIAKYAAGELKHNPCRRHVSCEIEVDRFSHEISSAALNRTLNKWGDAVVRDGSIPSGFEINTNPANGDLFLHHMKELCDGLAKINADCTTACGLHVHVNVKGNPMLDKNGNIMRDQDGHEMFDPRSAYNHYDLRRLILLYHHIEPAIFNLCAPRRLDAQYSRICGPFYMTKNTDPKAFRRDVMSKLYRSNMPIPSNTRELSSAGVNNFRQLGAELKEQKNTKYCGVRYKALNLHSFFLRGTIEFRHHEGTTNYDEMVNWALTCANVIDAASKMSEKDIGNLPNDPRLALIHILPVNLKQYAERKFSASDTVTPRFKQDIDERWRNLNRRN